ncbi:PEP-CTERM sorting domain-containing protein [archaeon]|nr:PEP-CTERM sorting domain-containing protein [archaeon]
MMMTMLIGALLLGAGTIETVEAAVIVSSFQDLIPGVGESGVVVNSMHMDINYDTGVLDNLKVRDLDTGVDSVVDEIGVWHLGPYKKVSGEFVFGAFANNDNWVADIGPGQAGWLDGYAYDSVFSEGESPDGMLLVFDPDGGQMALSFSTGPLVFDANTTLYWLDSLELDGSIGDASALVFSFGPSDVRIPTAVVVPEPATLTLLAVGGLVVLRRRRSRK